MRIVENKKELNEISGGGTYTAKCPHCDYEKSLPWSFFGTSYNTAKILAEQDVRVHVFDVHYLG